MRNELRAFLAALGFVSLVCLPSFANEAGFEITKRAFDEAISAVEKRDYSQLAAILAEHPETLDHKTETGDDLFHEFVFVLHEDGISNGIDLTAIEILLDHGSVPSVSNGLLGALLLEANSFDGAVDAYPVNSMICTDNRTSFFPLINRLVEVGAKFGSTKKEFRGDVVSEAFFYQFQLCHKPYVCGGSYERPSEVVLQRVSTSTTQTEKELLFQLANEGSHDVACLVVLND